MILVYFGENNSIYELAYMAINTAHIRHMYKYIRCGFQQAEFQALYKVIVFQTSTTKLFIFFHLFC
jgi:hypothetical protein